MTALDLNIVGQKVTSESHGTSSIRNEELTIGWENEYVVPPTTLPSRELDGTFLFSSPSHSRKDKLTVRGVLYRDKAPPYSRSPHPKSLYFYQSE